MRKTILILFTVIILSFLSNMINSDSVCSLKTLRLEVLEDLADNGMLDCLRVIEKPHFKEESEKEKNLRILAQWDTSCSFEATNSWFESVKANYGISELVDSNGDPVKKDFEDQADICEFIRAAASKNLFDIKNINMRKIPDIIIDKIDCPGAKGDKDGPRICAASSGSYYNKGAWTMFLGSSAIKFAGKPNFTKKINEPESLENLEQLETPSVFKDLLKYDKKQFISKGGLFAKLIDKTKSLLGLKNPEKNESNIKTFFSSGITSIQVSSKFTPISLKAITFPVEYTATKFSFYMVSFNSDNSEVLSLKSLLNDLEITETRQLSGPKMINSLTSAFVMNLDQNGNENGVTVSYKSNKEVQIQANGDTSNFTMVSIIFHAANIYKYVNYNNLEFKSNPADFLPMDDAKLVVRNDKNYDAYYLVFYNVAVNIKDSSTGEIFGTIMYQSTSSAPKELQNTTQIKGRGIYVSTHSAEVLKIKKNDSSTFTLGYIYSGSDNLVLVNDLDKNTVVGLSAIELPQNAKVHTFNPKRNTVLNSSVWKTLGFDDAKIDLKKPANILILFNFNIKVEGNDFTIRLKVNNKHSTRSVMSFKDSEYASGQGYVLESLKEGNYRFDLEFVSNAKGTVVADNNNSTVKLTKQLVSMTIIELD